MIYIVDDEPTKFFAISALLEAGGYSVMELLTASDAYDVLTKAELGKSDIILIDLMVSPGERMDLFTSGNTDGFLLTGRVLAEELLKIDRKKFTNKISIISGLRMSIDQRTREFFRVENIRFIAKRPNPKDFIQSILSVTGATL